MTGRGRVDHVPEIEVEHGKHCDVAALADVVQRALDGDGDAEQLLRELLGRCWRRLVVVAADADAG